MSIKLRIKEIDKNWDQNTIFGVEVSISNCQLPNPSLTPQERQMRKRAEKEIGCSPITYHEANGNSKSICRKRRHGL